MLEEIRNKLLKEARQSPNLLSDLAGLEQYIAESYYNRSFIELLQNADDAFSSKLIIKKISKYLFVANDGNIFTKEDFESLCRCASSNKLRGNAIGYRGIGFKSVVGMAKIIYLVSGELKISFSKELTAKDVPDAVKVPLIRIPHPVLDIDYINIQDEIQNLIKSGFKTIFVFTDIIASEIETEFSLFDFTSLLFLRNIKKLELKTSFEETITVKREFRNNVCQAILTTSKDVTNWVILSKEDISIAFRSNRDGIYRMKDNESLVHAFLPTEEATGMAIKINGDFSTEPSRRQIILDDITEKLIVKTAIFIIELLKKSLDNEIKNLDIKGIIKCLIYYTDPKIILYQKKSFKTELISCIKNIAGEYFVNIKCKPFWLNSIDYQDICNNLKIPIIKRDFENIEGLTSFLYFLGAKDLLLNDISNALFNFKPTAIGCAEIVIQLVNLYITNQLKIDKNDILSWNIWPDYNDVYSINDINTECYGINKEFIDIILEKIRSIKDLYKFLEYINDKKLLSIIKENFKENNEEKNFFKLVTNETFLKNSKAQALSLKKWRSAEQHTLAILKAKGYLVNDVSSQNLGYDLEGRTDKGENIFIEVKSIDYVGQPITLTNNEESASREKGDKYYIAVVKQNFNNLEICFIKDPFNKLSMTRKCKQWVWECSIYDFKPDVYELNS